MQRILFKKNHQIIVRTIRLHEERKFGLALSMTVKVLISPINIVEYLKKKKY